MLEKLNILYTCDNAYIPLTAISVASVVDNNKDSEICFYIATESKDSEEYRGLVDFYKENKKVRFEYLDCKKYDHLLEAKGFDRWGSNSYYVYWKLFAYDDINADRLWYLDSDVICMNEIDYPDIAKPVGAVLDSAHADFNMRAGINKDYYFFNTGSLFIDVKKWKEYHCTDKVINHIENIERMPLMCDQDILASALQEEIEVIDPKYNFLTGYDHYGVHNSFEMYSLNKKPFYKEKQIENAKDGVVFYHCLGGVFGRPWQRGNESPVRKEFNYYRRLSAWPEFETEMNLSGLFRIEKSLEVLPKTIYNRIHNLAQRYYLKKISQK